MARSSAYCSSCYRETSSDEGLCRNCAERDSPRSRYSRVVLLLGVAGLPVMFAGVLRLGQRACLIGAAISGVAVLLHVILKINWK
jgi:uncharacterized membrane protein YjjP (DUF1212 family)